MVPEVAGLSSLLRTVTAEEAGKTELMGVNAAGAGTVLVDIVVVTSVFVVVVVVTVETVVVVVVNTVLVLLKVSVSGGAVTVLVLSCVEVIVLVDGSGVTVVLLTLVLVLNAVFVCVQRMDLVVLAGCPQSTHGAGVTAVVGCEVGLGPLFVLCVAVVGLG